MIRHIVARLRSAPHPAFLIPAIILGWTIFVTVERYSVLPWIDQWSFLAEYQNLLDHGFSLGWLFASHNGHRIATSRPLFIADIAWFGARNTFLIVCVWATQFAGAALFVRLARTSQGRLLALGLAVALALLFSLAQWQNFLQGFQVQFVGVFALGAWLQATLLGGERTTPMRMVGAVLLLALATFTMANGFLAGIAASIVGALTRRHPWSSAAMLTASLILAAIYTLGTDVPRPPISRVLTVDWWLYVTVYLGNIFSAPLGDSIGWAAIVAGSLGLVLFGAAVARVALRPCDSISAVLAAIMTFVILSAALTALGRLDLGPAEAMNSRFATASAYFWAAAAIFWARNVVEIGDATLRRASVGIACVGLALLVGPIQYAGDLQTVYFARKIARAQQLLAEKRDVEALTILINHDPPFLQSLSGSYPRSLSILRIK